MSDPRPKRETMSLEEATDSKMWETRKTAMIEWVPYSDHKIKVCSQSLVDDRWLPLALVWKSVGSQELIKTVLGESTEICKSCKEADSIGLRKAKRWIDQNR